MQVSNYLKMNGYKYIDVKYFDATEILNDDIRYILNNKVREMRNKFEMLLVNKDNNLRQLS